MYTANDAPIIVITTPSHSDTVAFYRLGAYAKAVRNAGGMPILLPPAEISHQLLKACKGVILSGGGDVDPTLYGADFHSTTYGVDSERDAREIDLANYAFLQRIPMIGICRGLQILCVAFGGTLYPNLPDVFAGVEHRIESSNATFFPAQHSVRLETSSHLFKVVNSNEFSVASYHHCGVNVVPDGWRVAASAMDGAIEAMESIDINHPCIGLQYHPEIAYKKPESQRIFAWLVQQASSLQECGC